MCKGTGYTLYLKLNFIGNLSTVVNNSNSPYLQFTKPKILISLILLLGCCAWNTVKADQWPLNTIPSPCYSYSKDNHGRTQLHRSTYFKRSRNNVIRRLYIAEGQALNCHKIITIPLQVATISKLWKWPPIIIYEE